MTTTLWLRVSSVISFMFAGGHTLGGLKYWSPMGATPVLDSMRTVRFDTMGANRSYFFGIGLRELCKSCELGVRHSLLCYRLYASERSVRCRHPRPNGYSRPLLSTSLRFAPARPRDRVMAVSHCASKRVIRRSWSRTSLASSFMVSPARFTSSVNFNASRIALMASLKTLNGEFRLPIAAQRLCYRPHPRASCEAL